MSASEDESRTSAVGRKRALPADLYDHAAAAEPSLSKQARLTDTTSISSKESGEITDSEQSGADRSPPPESPSGSIFERWHRRKVVIPLSGVAKKPSVLETTAEKEARRNSYFIEDPPVESESDSEEDTSDSTESDSSDEESEDEESEDDPPHAMASPKAAATDHGNKPYAMRSTGQVRVRDLSEDDQDDQYRYFWDLDQEDHQDDLVYCLCCGGRGHMREICTERTCKHCNAVDMHISIYCPTYRKCTHCRQRGHDAADCNNRMRPPMPGDPCDVCGETGHYEVECLLRFKPAEPVQTEQPAEEPTEDAKQPGTPPTARNWMMGLFDDARD